MVAHKALSCEDLQATVRLLIWGLSGAVPVKRLKTFLNGSSTSIRSNCRIASVARCIACDPRSLAFSVVMPSSVLLEYFAFLPGPGMVPAANLPPSDRLTVDGFSWIYKLS